jgi:predicted MFS family arabinose efflux permease
VLAIARPGVFAALSVTFLYLTGGFVVISYLAPLAVEGAGLPASAVPGMLLVFGVGAVVGNHASGRLADRLGAARVVGASLVAFTAVCVAIFLVLTKAPAAAAGPLIMALMLPWGVVGWIFPPAQASRIVMLAPELADLTLPLNASAIYFGIAAGTVIGGQVLRVGPPAELALVAAGFPVAALAVLLARRGRRPAVAPGE